MAEYTNISTGPRGLRTVGALVMVDAGETVDVELAKGEDAAEEWFSAKAKGDAKAKPAAAKVEAAE